MVNAGTEAAHWVSTLQSFAIVAKIPAKAASAAIRPVLTATINMSMTALNLVDNVAVGKPSPIHQPTLEQRKQISLVLHDQLDPVHPLIGGDRIPGTKDQLSKNPGGGYSWAWRNQSIHEDNGFWMMFMPLPGAGFLKGAAARGFEEVAEEGANIAAKEETTFFEGASYSSKVVRQMGKTDDIFHAFPKSVDGFATKFGKWSTKVGADGKTYQWLEMGGSYEGKMGTFEYIKDANGIINHRFFNVSKVP